MPPAGAGHDRRLAAHSPGCARMVVGSHARFVAEENPRSRLFRQLLNRRELLLAPAANPFRILFGRAIQRALATQAQLTQQTAHTADTQLQGELLAQYQPNHLACPKCEFKTEPERTLARDRFVQPPHLPGRDLHRPPFEYLCLQCAPSARPVQRQPGVNTTAAESQRLDDHLGTLSRLHLLHRPDSNLLQSLVVQFTRVPSCHSSLYRMYTCLWPD